MLLDFELDNETYKLNQQKEQRMIEDKSEYQAGNIIYEQQANEAIDQWLSKNSLGTKSQ